MLLTFKYFKQAGSKSLLLRKQRDCPAVTMLKQKRDASDTLRSKTLLEYWCFSTGEGRSVNKRRNKHLSSSCVVGVTLNPFLPKESLQSKPVPLSVFVIYMVNATSQKKTLFLHFCTCSIWGQPWLRNIIWTFSLMLFPNSEPLDW